MAHDSKESLFTGITSRRWTGLILVSLSVLLLFVFLYLNARRAVTNEIRHQAMGVAIAIASAINPDDLAAVQGPQDATSEAYRRVQDFLGRVVALNPDIRYIYTMRRAPRGDATDADYEFIVDGPAVDVNGSGTIDREEVCEPPGKAYNAGTMPALIQAWYRAGADADVMPDPPYPDLMSGYAPIKNSRDQTVGVVGVDITAATVRMKLFALQGVMLMVWFVLTLLITLVVQLYYRQHEALETNQGLTDELAARNDMLRAANAQLVKQSQQFKRELKLAQTVQMGFVPKHFPRHDKIIFDKYYLSCEMLGGDLFDVFAIDDDHVGMYMADVAGHGVSAALISGLLRTAVAAARDVRPGATAHLQARLTEPDGVLAMLNDIIVKEIPEYEFITMIYAVLDIPHYSFAAASAGHPAPLRYDPRTKRVTRWNIPTGAALGLLPNCTYAVARQEAAAGDKVVFFTDGLTDVMSETNEEFGEARLIDVVEPCGQQAPSEIIHAVKQAVDRYRGARQFGDDFSILVAEIR